MANPIIEPYDKLKDKHYVRPRMNIIGEVYGNLTVKEELEPYVSPQGLKTRKYKCSCTCGATLIALQNGLRSGSLRCKCEHYPKRKDTLHIGCDRQDTRYNVWAMMVQRCNNPAHTSYQTYGGAGIVVCDLWLEPRGQGFMNFCEDMGERPLNYKLDRKDNSKGYYKENCRWVSDLVSVLNRGLGKNNTSGCKGVIWHNECSKWQAQLGFNYKSINLGLYEDWFEAVCARKSGENKYYKEVLDAAE